MRICNRLLNVCPVQPLGHPSGRGTAHKQIGFIGLLTQMHQPTLKTASHVISQITQQLGRQWYPCTAMENNFMEGNKWSQNSAISEFVFHKKKPNYWRYRSFSFVAFDCSGQNFSLHLLVRSEKYSGISHFCLFFHQFFNKQLLIYCSFSHTDGIANFFSQIERGRIHSKVEW